MSIGDLRIAENAFKLVNRRARKGDIKRTRASGARALSAKKLTRPGIGKGPEDGAGVLVHDLTKVHGDGEQDNEEKQVDAKK